MKVEIRTHGLKLTDELRAHVEKRLRFGLNWARDEVDKVLIRFTDINGPRGGDDKRCQVRIPLSGMRDVVIEDTAEDLRVAIDSATERASRTLERRLSRRREFGPSQMSRWEQAQDSI